MADYPRFPLFVDLSDRRVLVVGAGSVAARRVKVLTRFCGHIAVVAPRIHADIEALAEGGAVALRRRAYDPVDLEGADLVLAATDDAALNAAVAAACRARGIPVNDAGDRRLCDFYFPGIAMAGGVVAGVTADGEDHRLARAAAERVRRCLEEL